MIEPIPSLQSHLATLRWSEEPDVEATDALAQALQSTEAAERNHAARLLLQELMVPASRGRWAAIELLQSAWWPVDPALLPEVLRSTILLLEALPPAAPEVETASLMWTHLLRNHEAGPPTLSTLLSHPSAAVRAAAARTAARLDVGAESLELLLELSHSEPVEVAEQATRALSTLAASSSRGVGPALVRLVASYTDGRRPRALVGLRTLGALEGGQVLAELPELIPVLTRAVDAPAQIRAQVAGVLGCLHGVEDPRIRTTLAHLLEDPEAFVRVQGACALLQLGLLGADDATAVLAPALTGGDMEQADATLASLAGLEPAARAPLAGALTRATTSAPVAIRRGVVALFQTD